MLRELNQEREKASSSIPSSCCCYIVCCLSVECLRGIGDGEVSFFYPRVLPSHELVNLFTSSSFLSSLYLRALYPVYLVWNIPMLSFLGIVHNYYFDYFFQGIYSSVIHFWVILYIPIQNCISYLLYIFLKRNIYISWMKLIRISFVIAIYSSSLSHFLVCLFSLDIDAE